MEQNVEQGLLWGGFGYRTQCLVILFVACDRGAKSVSTRTDFIEAENVYGDSSASILLGPPELNRQSPIPDQLS